MKVLFCHDGPLRKDISKNYYGIAHNDHTFRRYYTIADKLNVAIRVNEVSADEAKDRLSKITVPNFEVYEIPNITSAKGVFEARYAKEKIKIAVENSDYIVARFPSIIGFHAFDEAKKLNKPCLVEVVACPWDAFWNHSLKGKVLAPFMYRATKRRVREATHVVYVTNEFLQNRYPTKGENTNCSNVALTKFDEKILARRIEKIENLNQDSKVVIGTTAAVNVRYKGQQYVIEALGKLKKQGITNYEYQLVGGGDNSYLKSVAEKYDVSDKVVFLGPMPHDEVFNWLETIDIYAQPSRQEGLPRGLIEAMSRGLPAFGANTAGIPELLESNFIFSNTKRNTEEICVIIKSMKKELLKEQAERNYNEAKKYDKDIIEKRRSNFFQDFIIYNTLD